MPEPNHAALKRIVTVVLGVPCWGAVLFASAGRIDWLRGWIFLALCIGSLLAAFVVMRIANPELIAARGTKHSDTKPFDKVLGAVCTLVMFALPVVAGLDAVRYGWSHMGWQTLYAGVALFVLGSIPILGSAAVNGYLETTVRIQQVQTHWAELLGGLARQLNPLHESIFANIRWTTTGPVSRANGPATWCSGERSFCGG